ncbi:FRG domain-containing protein [Pseudomonas sp. OTU750018]|uniref:FRG domain-containing protein n=1 Tax=Pseudomonas sp. OTU750018 TaxID=2709708 RepID=UPI00141F5C0A|nr:FRG domain-containing protein [Pseudomonas sp. OTU750018]
MFTERLVKVLQERNVSEELIRDVVDSGYIIRRFGGFGSESVESVSDKMFGSKQFSSIFDIDKFVSYIHGCYEFPQLPPFVEYTVKSFKEIEDILDEPRRKFYIDEGRMSFRGQTSQYTYKRKIPSPVRADKHGREISIFPGVFRQSGEFYSFNVEHRERRSLKYLLRELEPNNPSVYLDSAYAYDIMRVEQHYATQTSGLDVSFDIETAIFFATYKFQLNTAGRAYHTKIEKGDHKGVIYGFCFRDPPVKKTEFLVRDFDLFRTYKPERILRQNCGLPLFSEYDRNIAITDLDFIIYLDKDFDYDGVRTPDYMFPNTKDDAFYGKLLELKDKYPELLENIVEYEGSRAPV